MRSLVPFGLLYLVACDSDKSLTVQNPAPTADIISHDDGDEILEGFVITLTGLVSDSNHTPDQLTTTWVVNGEIVCENVIPDEGGGTSCDVVFTTDDTDITLQVKDAVLLRFGVCCLVRSECKSRLLRGRCHGALTGQE